MLLWMTWTASLKRVGVNICHCHSYLWLRNSWLEPVACQTFCFIVCVETQIQLMITVGCNCTLNRHKITARARFLLQVMFTKPNRNKMTDCRQGHTQTQLFKKKKKISPDAYPVDTDSSTWRTEWEFSLPHRWKRAGLQIPEIFAVALMASRTKLCRCFPRLTTDHCTVCINPIWTCWCKLPIGCWLHFLTHQWSIVLLISCNLAYFGLHPVQTKNRSLTVTGDQETPPLRSVGIRPCCHFPTPPKGTWRRLLGATVWYADVLLPVMNSGVCGPDPPPLLLLLILWWHWKKD